MKKITAFLIILLVFAALSLCVSAENGVKIVKTDVKADAIYNSEGFGCPIIDSVYEDDGETLVSIPENAIIDKNGNFVFPYKKSWLYYICRDGIVSLTTVYPEMHYYLQNGEDDKVGFFNLDGEELFPADSLWGSSFMTDGHAIVYEADLETEGEEKIRVYLVDRKGNVTLELTGGFTEFLELQKEGHAVSIDTLSMAGEYEFGLIGCWICETVEENRNEEGTLAVLNKKGETVITFDPIYGEFKGGAEGLFSVMNKESGLYGYVDMTGKLVIPCEFETSGIFRYGYAEAAKGGKYGYINKNGEVVIPFEYDCAYGYGNGLFSVVKDGKCGYVDVNNNVIVPLEYDDATQFDYNTAYAVKDGYVYVLTLDKDEIFVKVDGELLKFDVPPVLQNDRTLVPFRAIFEALGATVDWDDETQTATVVKDNTTLKITVGDNKLYKNNDAIELDVPAQIINDRTLVPVRAVSEAFGCEVNWLDQTQTVVIFSE